MDLHANHLPEMPLVPHAWLFQEITQPGEGVSKRSDENLTVMSSVLASVFLRWCRISYCECRIRIIDIRLVSRLECCSGCSHFLVSRPSVLQILKWANPTLSLSIIMRRSTRQSLRQYFSAAGSWP